MKTVIEIHNISKKFKIQGKPFFALEDVNLDVLRGEIFALVGPNGSGKTTLLNIISGMLIPDNGWVKVLGKDVHKDRAIIERVSFVSAETRFHWVLNIKDILNFYARAYGLGKEKRDEKIKELVEFFNIKNIMNRRFDSLSTGERMRLVFAKSLLNEPEILFLDEPTLGLDPDMALRLRNEIKKINREFKTTIFFTSHYMQEVQRLSQRVVFIYKGRIIKIDKTKNIANVENYFIKTLKQLEAKR